MVDIRVSQSFPYKGSIEQLEEFVAAAKKYELTHFTWNAYRGDQRDPDSLTLEGSKER